MISIGEKIKFFRKRSDITQLELELLIEASNGSISRIENNEVNPTKETIDKICEVLKLPIHESNYIRSAPLKDVTAEDIQKAAIETKSILQSKSSFAYLLDEKHRILEISKALQTVLKLSDEDKKDFVGINLFESIWNPEMPGYKLIDPSKFEQILKMNLARLYYEFPYIEIEPYWIDLINKLNKYPIFKKAWREVKESKDRIDIYSEDAKLVYFNLYGFQIKLHLTEEYLIHNPRFSIVVYSSNNRLVNFLSKLLI